MTSYTDSNLWLSTLATKTDRDEPQRERLRNAYLGFRDRVGQLIQTIPRDIQGLTVHDLTHLDALWGMADVLTDGKYALNPAESFVFGGSILLHDSAMTVCAYQGGLSEIKQTPEYSDAIAHFLSHSPSSRRADSTEVPKGIDALAIAETLRLKHASKAEELALQLWKNPIDSSNSYLIEDSELRDHFGCTIGRIAHSHHWEISEIPKRFGTVLGAFTGFPSEWTIDPIKIALLLRCVDAMHVDDRRAPRFLASIREIGPASIEHWKFQNKLSQPHIQEGKMVYTSKKPFEVEEAMAWNLCFDTLQMIDRELRNSNDIHLQKRLQPFSATGVAGATSADALAKYVQVEGWRPLPLNLKVSNVPKLARTLGGRDLYNNPLTPLRELLQNAADAIDAREVVENDFLIKDGLISIRFIENKDETILEIDDNGVGMSERILTTALLDFGFSFWSSADARAEFPGLQPEVERFRGRYGIGFFSVFMWASEVTVCSRRFNEGIDFTRVLEFREGVESRPILRNARPDEKSSKWNTRVRLKLKADFLTTAISSKNTRHRAFFDYAHGGDYPFSNLTWPQRLRLLCGALPVKVIFEFRSTPEQVSLTHWRDCEPKIFLDFFSDIVFHNDETTMRFGNNLTTLSDAAPKGGRCFVSPYQTRRSSVAVYEKGIFIGMSSSGSVQGIIESNATNAARDQHAQLSINNDKEWISKIRSRTFASCRDIGETIAVQGIFLALADPDPNQLLFLKNRKFVSHTELIRQIAEDGSFMIRLSETGKDEFSWKAAESLSIVTGLSVDERRIHPLATFDGTLKSQSEFVEVIDKSDEPLFKFLRQVRDLFGENVEFKSERFERDGYQNDYLDIRIAPRANV